MNQIFAKSCEDMSELADGSVDLIVTSPPYNAGMEYENELDWPERFIKLYTYRNDVVLDPFAGSGTTLLAAERLDRRWVGYETEQGYIDIFNKRLTSSEMQSSMFL